MGFRTGTNPAGAVFGGNAPLKFLGLRCRAGTLLKSSYPNSPRRCSQQSEDSSSGNFRIYSSNYATNVPCGGLRGPQPSPPIAPMWPTMLAHAARRAAFARRAVCHGKARIGGVSSGRSMAAALVGRLAAIRPPSVADKTDGSQRRAAQT